MAAAIAALCKSCFVGADRNSGVVVTTPSISSSVKINGGVLDTRDRGIQLGGAALGFYSLPVRRKMNRAVSASSALPQVELESRRGEVSEAIAQGLDNCLTESFLDEVVDGLGPKIRGKVSFFSFTLCLRKCVSLSSSVVLFLLEQSLRHFLEFIF
jgi:hypothetical protein